MTREAALACGKSVPIGTDPFGRTYWVFSAEPTSLFVCQSITVPGDATSPSQNHWYRFHKPEEIAAVMVCLGKNPLRETLKEVFPDARLLCKGRSWSTLLFDRCLPKESEAANATPQLSDKPKSDGEEQDLGPVSAPCFSLISIFITAPVDVHLFSSLQPFVEDEDVLVESENGKFLWDAVIVDVSKDPETDKVKGYLVHYKNWNSRFDQWVAPDRVVEPSTTNTEVQDEVIQDFTAANEAAPPELEAMFAYQFLNAKKRARSTPVNKAELFETAFTRPSASPSEKLFGLLKGALLLIEAALPRGSIASPSWDSEAAALWRNFVKDAQGPESLMRCTLLLEDAISSDWFHSQATQLYASMATQWRAMGEATLSAIALRISVLDRCLKYQQRKKKHDRLSLE